MGDDYSDEEDFGADEGDDEDGYDAPAQPMTAALRRSALASADDVPEPSTITYKGQMRVSPAVFEKLANKDTLVFSVAKGTMELDDVVCSNSEDLSEAMNKLGACDIVDYIDFKLEHNTGDLANYQVQIPAIKALARDKFPLKAQTTDALSAPHGTFAKDVSASTEPKRILDRQLAKKKPLFEWLRKNPGQTLATLKESYTINGAKAYVTMEPKESPLVEFYEAIPEVAADPKKHSLKGREVNEHGEVASNPAFTRRAALEAEQAMHDNVGYSHVTDAKQMTVLLRAKDEKRMQADGTARPERTHLSKLHEKAIATNPRFGALTFEAATGNQASAKRLSALKANAMKQEFYWAFEMTVGYYKMPPPAATEKPAV